MDRRLHERCPPVLIARDPAGGSPPPRDVEPHTGCISAAGRVQMRVFRNDLRRIEPDPVAPWRPVERHAHGQRLRGPSSGEIVLRWIMRQAMQSRFGFFQIVDDEGRVCRRVIFAMS